MEKTIVGGKTAVNVGGKVLKYMDKKPFLSNEKMKKTKDILEKESAETIFYGLVMFKGTALKIAQLLSLELDIIPESIRKKLEKSYN